MVRMPDELFWIDEELFRLKAEKEELLARGKDADQQRLAYIEMKIKQLERQKRIIRARVY